MYKRNMYNNYPIYDFRYLLTNNASEKELINSLSRENIYNIIQSWNYLKHDQNLFKVFAKGLENGIQKERYPFEYLPLLIDYPEFNDYVINGLYLCLDKYIDTNDEKKNNIIKCIHFFEESKKKID